MAEEDSRDIANDSDSLFELEIESDGVQVCSRFYLSHSTASPPKMKVTRTWLR